MPRFPFVAGASVVVASIAWALRLVAADEPLAGSSAVLVAADGLLLALVAAGGLLLARSRWSRYLSVAVLAAEAAVAAFLPWDGWSAATIAGLALAAGVVAAPPLTSWVRRLPAAGRPSMAVVAIPLGLLAMPGAVGVAMLDGPGAAQWVLAGLALVLAWSYGRAHVAGLWGLRLAFPVAAAVAAVTAGWPGWLVIALTGAAITALSWRREARLAAVPLAPPRVPVFRIPPELAPPEVLEAAGLDRQGRRRSET